MLHQGWSVYDLLTRCSGEWVWYWESRGADPVQCIDHTPLPPSRTATGPRSYRASAMLCLCAEGPHVGCGSIPRGSQPHQTHFQMAGTRMLGACGDEDMGGRGHRQSGNGGQHWEGARHRIRGTPLHRGGAPEAHPGAQQRAVRETACVEDGACPMAAAKRGRREGPSGRPLLPPSGLITPVTLIEVCGGSQAIRDEAAAATCPRVQQ